MANDMELIDKLPSLDNALSLPKQEFEKIARAFMDYSAHCESFFLPPKIQEWCQYLKCESGTCTYQFTEYNLTKSVFTTTASVSLITKDCFDIFFCPPNWSSSINHYCIGIMCFLFLICALILNIIYLPSFTRYGQRNGTDFLLTMLAVCDIFLIIISIYIDCVPFLYKTQENQKNTYSKFVAILIPYFLPFHSFFQTFGSWILICLLFERYLYQQHGKHAKLIFSTKIIIFTIISVGSILFAFTVAKLFEMTSKSKHGYFRAVYFTNIGLNENYHNLITNWLKVPLEYFGPILVFVCLLCMIYTNLGEQGISMNKTIEEKSANYKKLIKNLVIINENEREDRILISVLLLSTIAIVVKLPRFVYHILINEEANISPDKLIYVMISYTILDAINAVVRPCTYIYISPKYCTNIHGFFIASCPAQQEETVGMTFEQTIANKMRESISYRNSIWASNPEASGQSGSDPI